MCCGSPTRRAAPSVCPLNASPTSSWTPGAPPGSGSAPDASGGAPVSLLDRRLLFVTGKGGVGKTTVAAALGLLAASTGRRTLVCDTDATGDLADAWEVDPFGFAARQVQPNLSGMVMDTEESLKEYLRLHLRIPLLTRIGPLARSFDFVATAAPGVKEVLTVGKLAYEVRENHYDLVVVDAPATGHVVGQLSAPAAIRELVRVGMIRDQTDWMLDILSDPAQTGMVLVAVPEEMPVTETLELANRLDAETDVSLAAVVVNRVLPELFGRREEGVFDAIRSGPALAHLTAEAGKGVPLVFDGAELAITLRRSRAEHIARLRSELPAGVPVMNLPYLFTRAHGIRATRQLADALGDEIGM
ncbi:MAG: ArsA family ATPase [Acidimicrobiales bacterium]|nr:ArsA family ATPase [Acidimicrobiales bacterium]